MFGFNRHHSDAYRNVRDETLVSTADNHGLIELIFSTLVESLNLALKAMQQGNQAEQITYIQKSIRLIDEGLRSSLDMKNGGEISANLASLYDYCVLQLTKANSGHHPEMVQEVLNLISPVHEAWKAIKPTAAPTAPNQGSYTARTQPRVQQTMARGMLITA